MVIPRLAALSLLCVCISVCVCVCIGLEIDYSQRLITGVNYMVFGERLNTFDDSRKDLQEFQNASIEPMSLVDMLLNGPPVYKYCLTKNYQHFVGAINCTCKTEWYVYHWSGNNCSLCDLFSVYLLFVYQVSQAWYRNRLKNHIYTTFLYYK